MARKKADENKPLAPAAGVHQLPHQQNPFQSPINGMQQQQPIMAPPAPAPSNAFNNPQGRSIDVANFLRVRESVYARLTTIQELVGSFANDYLKQTNLLLGEPTYGDGGELPIAQDFGPIPAGALPIPFSAPAVEEKKERKKRQHDPNAPKRPLTPYFLYMQTARPIIAADLGDGVPKGAVQEEGQRRWASMSLQEKLGWNQAYQYNLRLYNARVHSYKAGNLLARDMDDEEAVRYCEDFNIPMPHVGGVESEAVAEGSVVPQQLINPTLAAPIQPEPAAKPAAKPKASRKRKADAVEPAQSTPIATPAAVAAPVATPTDKKPRKRATKAEQADENQPKKSGRKKAKSG